MTTPQAHGHQHSEHQGTHGGHQHTDEPGMAEMLDLDALLLHEHLQEIFDWTAAHQPAPRNILDLGAGTGTGTLGLARTFPEARVSAVDQSEFMLGRLGEAVERHQLQDRVALIRADLDTAWPQLRGLDLIWAASSMHHMTDPGHVFTQISGALAPGGLLVVAEMDSLPRYLPEDLGVGTPGLEQRCHDEASRAGWNSHPDWAPAIQAAGLEIVEQRSFAYATSQDRELVARTAHTFLSRMRTALDGKLPAGDLAVLDQLLEVHGPHALVARKDLSMRGSRTVWAARKAG